MLKEILESKKVTKLEKLDKDGLQEVVSYIEEKGANLNDLYCYVKNSGGFEFLIVEDCKNKKGWQFPIENNVPKVDDILSANSSQLVKIKDLL